MQHFTGSVNKGVFWETVKTGVSGPGWGQEAAAVYVTDIFLCPSLCLQNKQPGAPNMFLIWPAFHLPWKSDTGGSCLVRLYGFSGPGKVLPDQVNVKNYYKICFVKQFITLLLLKVIYYCNALPPILAITAQSWAWQNPDGHSWQMVKLASGQSIIHSGQFNCDLILTALISENIFVVNKHNFLAFCWFMVHKLKKNRS